MPPSLFAGFILGFSLIMAIGSQNAFVLRQGLRRQHVFWICLTCATSDALLITGGVMGFGSLTLLWPWFEQAMRWGGAGFLIWYGGRSLLAAWRGGESLEAGASTGAGATVLPVLATVLALTWLNPHVYLDTVVLLGAISAQYPQPLWFGIGAALASFTFFFSLGYGAAALAPLFARPRAWQILDLLVGLTMWAIAVKLLLM
ncbi:LysE/ArgO family amino acid transporter [Parasedimentitalea psychrophila]|uniref:LysE/ArgO family amino acid transporter n=1 Tax=Parasedimentitalea psychrophila TaxID=2997337 RepID=A0A9Y2P563_9RHOB|nr:LysE/ArgO family amino acid transporter [Parasedimentitalea psychrophila]WIY27617.1 LysE/ArgO family amino acid transporter [Parasedimentitalea psychrophila]